MNTNMHVTSPQITTLLGAVRYQLARDTSGDDRTSLHAAEQMLLAARERIRDLELRRAR